MTVIGASPGDVPNGFGPDVGGIITVIGASNGAAGGAGDVPNGFGPDVGGIMTVIGASNGAAGGAGGATTACRKLPGGRVTPRNGLGPTTAEEPKGGKAGCCSEP